MQIQPCTVRLKDGREVLLRSTEAADAQALLDYMRVTSGETHFMARYPEECQATVEQETGFIEALTGHFRRAEGLGRTRHSDDRSGAAPGEGKRL